MTYGGMLKIRIIVAALWIALAFAATISATPIYLMHPAHAQVSLEVPLARDEEKIAQLERQMVSLQGSSDQLSHDVWVWKGIVMGFGSIVSLIELLQALGMIRSGLDLKKRRSD